MPIIIDLIQDKYAKKTSNWEKLKQIVVYQVSFVIDKTIV